MLTGKANAIEHKPVRENAIVGYWLWAGLTVSNNLSVDVPLYVYQGLLTSNHKDNRFIKKGLYPHPIYRHPVLPTLRLEGELPDVEILQAWIVSVIDQWQKHGTQVAGIQLDFDSATAKLLSYSLYLNKIRRFLPETYTLSVTGLGDWVTNGDRNVLKSIVRTSDEVVFQLYQGREPLAGIDSYVENLCKLDVPFKIGLIDSSENFRLLDMLSDNPHFRGVVLFLQR